MKSRPNSKSKGPVKAKAKAQRKAGPGGKSKVRGGRPRLPVLDGVPEPVPQLTLALPAGRIRDEAIALFAKAGLDISAADKQHAGRRLVIAVPAESLTILIVRDTDVPAYVEGGAADMGIAGRDVLEEQDRDLYEPLDLEIGKCRMSVAEPEDRPVDEAAHIHLRYASKFPEITRRHLQSRGTVAEVIKLYGSVEIAPLVGLADRIVDLVSSGETLRQHRLREVETIMEVSARLCVGRAAAKLKAERIDDLVRRLAEAVSESRPR